MAWYGSETVKRDQSILFLLGYWGLFLLLVLVALYVVLLDVRYIRLQYKLGQREIFLKTLGSEEFRRALRRSHQQKEPPDDKAG